MDDAEPDDRLPGDGADEPRLSRDHDHIFYMPPDDPLQHSSGPYGAIAAADFRMAPPDGYDPGHAYSGPRVSVPDTPPPPPPIEHPSTRRGARVAAAVLAVVVVAGGAWLVSLARSDSSASPPTNSSTGGGSGSENNASAGSQGSSTSANKLDLPAIARAVDPAVVDITSTLALNGGEAAGTGMVVTPSGEVLTNNHVIDQAISITGQIDGRGPRYAAKVIGTDPTSDIALIQLEGVSGLRTVSFGDSSTVTRGESRSLQSETRSTFQEGPRSQLGRSQVPTGR